MQTREEKEEKIKNLLTRNVETVIERSHLEAALRGTKKLRVKLGIDPTAPDLHLGHAVVLRKLREFQDLGHAVVLIIGDFTALIGDPTGKSKTRPPLSKKEIEANLKTYLKQAKIILDTHKTEIRYNSEWLQDLRGHELIKLLSMVSVQQILGREDFSNRLTTNDSIRGHELLYPIMQAYDSIAIKADIEIGGTDQTFNLLMGRQLMERVEMKPQDILTVSLLVGTDGVKKMSKSLGNYIGLTDTPDDMFGKAMSMHDSMISNYFHLATRLDKKEIAGYEKKLQQGVNPRDIKKVLAREIVSLYHGTAAAEKAAEKWEKLFSNKDFSTELSVLDLRSEAIHSALFVQTKGISPVFLIVKSGVTKSNSEARRLVEEGGFRLNGVQVKNTEPIQLKDGDTVKIGKKNFFRIKI